MKLNWNSNWTFERLSWIRRLLLFFVKKTGNKNKIKTVKWMNWQTIILTIEGRRKWRMERWRVRKRTNEWTITEEDSTKTETDRGRETKRFLYLNTLFTCQACHKLKINKTKKLINKNHKSNNCSITVFFFFCTTQKKGINFTEKIPNN